MSDLTLREVAARALAGLAPGEDWPTNEALGGNLTGTRDDEFRAAMLDQAADVLAAVAADDGLDKALRGHGGGRTQGFLPSCDCGEFIGTSWLAWRADHAAHLADVVRGWLTGQEGT